MNNTILGFWQHTNGGTYAVECDTLGKIMVGVRPLDPNDLQDLDGYIYKLAITGWLTETVAQQHKLRRITPTSSR